MGNKIRGNSEGSPEPSPDGHRWFRISERQLYYLEQLAEQHGAMSAVVLSGAKEVHIPDGMSYVSLREKIRFQQIKSACCDECGHHEFWSIVTPDDRDPIYICKQCEHKHYT